MDHILQQMQAFSQQCAEILSEIVGIDVSITDNQQMRIAGSGRMKGRVGNIAAYGHIALHALETRQTTVVSESYRQSNLPILRNPQYMR